MTRYLLLVIGQALLYVLHIKTSSRNNISIVSPYIYNKFLFSLCVCAICFSLSLRAEGRHLFVSPSLELLFVDSFIECSKPVFSYNSDSLPSVHMGLSAHVKNCNTSVCHCLYNCGIFRGQLCTDTRSGQSKFFYFRV